MTRSKFRLKTTRSFKTGAAIILLVFSFSAAPHPAQRARRVCYLSDKVCITSADPEDAVIALHAVDKAYRFFTAIGYQQRYPLEIVFQESVWITPAGTDAIRVVGKLSRGRIHLTSRSEPWLSESNSYGLPMDQALYESLIVHETAHFLSSQISRQNIDIALSEYIAYVVQLSQMDPRLKEALLDRYELAAFETGEIDLDVMLLDPVVFAVKSYLHNESVNGRYLRNLLRGDIEDNKRLTCWQIP